MHMSQVWRQVGASAKVVFDNRKQFLDLARTRIQLSNSFDRPLDVRIKLSTNVKDKTPTANLLREYVSRFRSLDIQVPTYKTAASLVSLIGEGKPAPLLERLDIHVEQRITVDDDTAFFAFPNAFYPCPRLTHLTIPGIPLPVPTAPHFLSLASLTIDAMTDFDIDVDNILDVLDSTKDLLHFTYRGTDVFSYSDTSDLDYPRITSMPRLISADVSAPGCGLDILRTLDAPLLTNARFDGWRDERFAEEWADSLTGPISASLRRLSERSPNLTHLELHSTKMLNADNDYQWLMSDSAFPRLEMLRLDAADITDSSLRLGAGKMGSLKKLELRACEGVSGDGILKFAEGRNRDFELLIDACPSVKPEDLAKLTKIVKVL